MNIINRDGSIAEFNRNRIFNAIKAAFEACNEEYKDYEIERLTDEIPIWNNIHVEDIQNQIEEILMDYGFHNVAREYILYRNDHAKLRQSKLTKKVGEKLEANNVQNQNANIDEHSFGGRQGEAGRVVTKDYALEFCMSAMAKNNHLNNEIYIHDLDSYAVGMHNCLSIPFDDLLANGFNTRQTDVRPANSINTAFQLVAVIFQLQSLQQFGGVSATHLDWTMVPYVRKSFYKHLCNYIYLVDKEWVVNNENYQNYTFDPTKYSLKEVKQFIDEKAYNYSLQLTEKELNQAVEGMYHNLNTLQSRSGNQLPFTSINYGTCTLPEGRMVIKALLNGSIKGVGKYHKTPIFPCGIFQSMEGVNRKEGDPNYDLFKLALESTAKRLYPNYANVNWSGNADYDINDPRTYFSTMGK